MLGPDAMWLLREGAGSWVAVSSLNRREGKRMPAAMMVADISELLTPLTLSPSQRAPGGFERQQGGKREGGWGGGTPHGRICCRPVTLAVPSRHNETMSSRQKKKKGCLVTRQAAVAMGRWGLV